jgi:hypothetical protein
MSELLTYNQIDELVDTDPLRLRDLTWELTSEVQRLRCLLNDHCGHVYTTCGCGNPPDPIQAYYALDEDNKGLRAANNNLRAQRDKVLRVAPALLAECLYDDAHENCDDEGCAGGGMNFWLGWAEANLMPTLRAIYAELTPEATP